ncbi:GNAT family N-acetyltransferase [Microvirga vignae]|uniref:GNAT family N-acetyltransferase n=1 Tax=Microvirga vignae TaxID=1225564 RepID=UPI000A8C23AD|nr:GNAT family N-acetyltransferase [Microvirga vignae]
METSLYGRIRTVTVREFDALAPHAAAWDRLGWEAPQKTPTLLPGWVDAFLRHRLKPNENWFCSFAYLDDTLVGVLPIIISPHSVLRHHWPLLRTAYDALTPSGDVLLASEYAAPAFRALLTEVNRQVPNHLGLELKAVRCNSPVWEATAGGSGSYIIRTGLHSLYSYLNVEGDFSAYRARLGRLREDLRRFHRKLEARGPVLREIRKGPAAGEAFLSEFVALEASGWKGRNGTSILNDPSASSFYTTLVRNFALQGRWEWQAIRVGDRLVAAGMGVRCGTTLMLPKFAFDESFSECRPGSLLVETILEDAFSRQDVAELHPMSSFAWSCHWRMSHAKYTDLYLIRRGILPILFKLPCIVVRSLYQNLVRPWIPRAVINTYHRFKRRGGRKPCRAADSRSVQPQACDY